MNRPKQSTKQPDGPASAKPVGRIVFLGCVGLACCAVVGYVMMSRDSGGAPDAQAAVSEISLEEIPFDGTRAYEYLEQIVQLGPRPSGSEGMRAQQRLLTEHFTTLGGKVSPQEFGYRHPLDGSRVAMANLIVQWHPERKERILLAAHYDTLPFPMLDPRNPRGTFVGANDGGSGVALLMALGHEIPKLKTGYGVDFVLFDAEEFVFARGQRYFVGSEWFARQYVATPRDYRYRWGVLLDMIGDADLQIYQERTCLTWPETRPLVGSIWETARRLGVREFVPAPKYTVRDDHLMLRNIGRIPTCVLIDFDYPSWHTEQDTAERCSALSLAKVGWVVREWLDGLGQPAQARQPGASR